MKQLLAVKLVKKGNKLVMSTKLDTEKYKIFIASLEEGTEIEGLFEVKEKDNTKMQLAKIHVCIKEMANEQGDDIPSMKREVKRRCGMSYTDDNGKEQFESFADCSKEELSNVIEEINKMGAFMNINFEGTTG